MLAVDQRGHGESEIGLAEDFSIGAMVTDLRHTLQEHRLLEGGEKVVLVGHSMVRGAHDPTSILMNSESGPLWRGYRTTPATGSAVPPPASPLRVGDKLPRSC